VNGDGDKNPKASCLTSRPPAIKPVRSVRWRKWKRLTTSDGLIDLLYKLKAKYRKNAVWVMNSNTAAKLQKLKTVTGITSGAIVWLPVLPIRCWAVLFSI
jgi:HK97 family phage major capsid protein